MLEIILLIFLTRHVGEIVESKGRKSGWYKLITVLLWIGCEIGGALVGAVVVAVASAPELLIYLFALLGAAAGAGISLLVAKSVKPLTFDQPPQPPTFGSSIT